MVESKLVELVVAGSNPVGHPSFPVGQIRDSLHLKQRFPRSLFLGKLSTNPILFLCSLRSLLFKTTAVLMFTGP
jgi:hypothetical protein